MDSCYTATRFLAAFDSVDIVAMYRFDKQGKPWRQYVEDLFLYTCQLVWEYYFAEDKKMGTMTKSSKVNDKKMYHDWVYGPIIEGWLPEIEFPAGDEMAVPFMTTTSRNAGPAPNLRHSAHIVSAFGAKKKKVE
jgi:hypothetical protein